MMEVGCGYIPRTPDIAGLVAGFILINGIQFHDENTLMYAKCKPCLSNGKTLRCRERERTTRSTRLTKANA